MAGQQSLQRAVRQWCRYGVRAIIVLAPLAMGGAHLPVNIALTSIAVLLLLAFVIWGSGTKSIYGELPMVLIAVPLVLSLLQVIPLPPNIVEFLSPGAYAIWTNAFGERLAAMTLSVAPLDTFHEIIKLVGYFCVAVLVGNLFRRSDRRLEIQETIAVAGGLVAAVGFAHMLLGLTQSFSQFGRDDLLFPSTLINPHHLAGFLGLASLVAVGLAIEIGGPRRWYYAGSAVLCGSGVFLSLSRAGILAYCVMGLLFAIVWSVREPKATFKLMAGTIGAATAGGLILVSMIGFRPIVYELWTIGGEHALSKTAIWNSVPKLMADFPLTGIGRGAFASLGPMYFDSTQLTWTHLENEWLQTLVDWGPIGGGCILLLGILTFLAVLFRGRQLPTQLAPVFGLCFLGIQNIMDFSFTIAGIAIPVIALLSSVLAAPRKSKDSIFLEKSISISRPVMGGVALVLGVFVVNMSLHGVGHSLLDDLNTVKLVAKDKDVVWEDTEKTAYELLEHRPASYFIPLVMAKRAASDEAGLRSGMSWVNRAMFLNPRSHLADFFAARLLWRLGFQQQAVLEYRLAGKKGYSVWNIATELYGKTGGKLDFAKDLAGDWIWGQVTVARFVLSKGQPELALEILGDHLGQVPEQWHEIRVSILHRLKRPSEAKKQAERLQEAYPQSPKGYQWMAALLHQENGLESALMELEKGLEVSSKKGALLISKAGILLKARRMGEAKQVAGHLLTISLESSERARAISFLAQIETIQGRRLEAMKLWRRSLRVHPSEEAYLALAGLREDLTDFRGAIDVLEEGKSLVRSKVWEERMGKLRAQLGEAETKLKRDFSLR